MNMLLVLLPWSVITFIVYNFGVHHNRNCHCRNHVEDTASFQYSDGVCLWRLNMKLPFKVINLSEPFFSTDWPPTRCASCLTHNTNPTNLPLIGHSRVVEASWALVEIFILLIYCDSCHWAETHQTKTPFLSAFLPFPSAAVSSG